IRDSKASGLGLFPSQELKVNQAWLSITFRESMVSCASAPGELSVQRQSWHDRRVTDVRLPAFRGSVRFRCWGGC
ncbi:hypothetical protein, partial [Streptomyces tateyamensis]|uniref:hypothetical protein n=1 Tax=Streptomyces tateyamensis TaxID=565073 RepID=UPI001C645B6E